MRGDNLKQLTHEENVNNGSKGGQKSGEVRRQKKSMKDALELILSLPAKKQDHLKVMEYLGIEDEEKTNAMTLMLTVFQQALNGDLKAAEFIRDTVGEKPDLNVNSKMDVNTTESKVHVYLPDNGRDKKDE